MARSFIETTTKKGTKYRVHVSYRKEGKTTSTNCGCIENIEKIKKEHPDDFDSFIRNEGQKIYDERKETLSTKHTFVFDDSKDNEDAYSVNIGQCYLKKIWNNLGINKLMHEIKPKDKMKFKYDLNELAFYLVSKQILDPKSKLKAFQDRERFLFHPDVKQIEPFYHCLSILSKHANEINLSTYKKAKKYIEKSSKLYFYDVTSVNLSKKCPVNDIVGLKKGKEGIYGPLIQIGYLCDEWGLLIGLLVFKGSESEQETLKEQITKLYGSTKLKDVVICTDAGLCSLKNKRFSEHTFKGYITTQSLKKNKVPNHVRERALDYKYKVGNEMLTKEEIVQKYEELIRNGQKEEAEILYSKTFFGSRRFVTTSTISFDKKEKIKSMKTTENFEKSCKTLAKYSENEFKKIEKSKPLTLTFEQRLVISFSLKYYFAQLSDLEKDKAKAEDAIKNQTNINGSSKKDFKRFLTTTKASEDGEIVEEIPLKFLTDVYEAEKRMCGLYCQATNLDDKESVIYKSARERWVIEDSFRTAKSDLSMGTVYLSTIDHIKGHFEICFLAQTLLKVFIYKIYNRLEETDTQIGKLNCVDREIYTKDNILNELRELTGLIKKDSNNVLCVISERKKNELNKLFASTFKFSMTKQVSIVSELKKI